MVAVVTGWPMCGDMIGVAKGIAGLGALFYVALRVWQTLARAEPIDVYPLLRPFALGLCILFFPMVLETINGVLSPVVQGTHKMLEKQTFSMDEYRKLRDKLEYEAPGGPAPAAPRSPWFQWRGTHSAPETVPLPAQQFS